MYGTGICQSIPASTQIRVCVLLDAVSIWSSVKAKSVLTASQNRQKTILMKSGSLMKVESIAKCFPWTILQ